MLTIGSRSAWFSSRKNSFSFFRVIIFFDKNLAFPAVTMSARLPQLSMTVAHANESNI